MQLSYPIHRLIPADVVYEMIWQTDDAETLAVLCLVSFAHLKVAGPELYHTVTLLDRDQAGLFFDSQHRTPIALNRIQGRLAREQTRHLIAAFDRDPAPQRGTNIAGSFTWTSAQAQAPLNVTSLVARTDLGLTTSCTFTCPRILVVVPEGRCPTRLAEVTLYLTRGSEDVTARAYNSPRLREVVYGGMAGPRFYSAMTWPEATIDSWIAQGVRVTMDLSMIDQPSVDARNPNGSCQRLLEAFVRNSRMSPGRWFRARIWVGNETMRAKFEVARDAVRARLLQAGENELHVNTGELEIEVTENTSVRFGYTR